jgi:hypothetical protein
MAEILICLRSATHPDATKDRRGCWKRGLLVTVQEDGHPWGAKERYPAFAVLSLPLVPVARLQRYVEPQWEIGPTDPEPYRRRLWRLRIADMPPAKRKLVLDDGRMTVKGTPKYTGPYDALWIWLRRYLRNQFTNLDEDREL